MTEKLPKSDDSVGESASPDGSGRRKFIKDSLGAAPVVLTIGNRSGWGGGSMHGTLWSSAGTKWRHKGDRWWGKGDWKDWDEPKPPHWSDKDNRRKYQPRDDGRKDGRKDARKGEWDWGEESKSTQDSDAFRDARADWEWYKEKERRRSESGKVDEKLLRPLEPPKRSDR